MKSSFVVGLAAALAIGAAASAQTLGDVERQEEARRKTVKAPAKVYTNDSLRADPSEPRPAAAGAAGSTGTSAPGASQQAATPAPAPEAGAKGSAQDEASWKKRMADARDALER